MRSASKKVLPVLVVAIARAVMVALILNVIFVGTALAELTKEEFYQQFLEYIQKKDNNKVAFLITQNPTTAREVQRILEEKGLKAGRDFYLAFSPEREDPNNKDFST